MGKVFTSVTESCQAIKFVIFIDILYVLGIRLQVEDQRMIKHCPYSSEAWSTMGHIDSYTNY